MRILVFMRNTGNCGGRAARRLPRGRSSEVSGRCGGPRRALAAARPHRRAVAPRAARARNTVVAGCGIGPHAAGEAVTSASAHARLDAGMHDSADHGIAAISENARRASSNNRSSVRGPCAPRRSSVAAPCVRHRTQWTCGRPGRRRWRERARWPVATARGICRSSCARYCKVGPYAHSGRSTGVEGHNSITGASAKQLCVCDARRVGEHHRRKCVARAHRCRKWSQQMTDAVRIVAHQWPPLGQHQIAAARS